MKLVILQDFLRNGGTEQQTLAIAEGLAKRGVDVHLAVFRSGGVLDTPAAKLPITVHFLKQGFFHADWFAPGLKRLLTQLAPDAVIPMGRMANCHAGLLSFSKNRPYTLFSTFRTGRPIPYLYRQALRRSDHVISNSQEALRRISAKYGIHRPDTSSVIYNGCIRDFETHIPTFRLRGDLASSPVTPSPTLKVHFVSISMFRPQKKQIRLLRICSKLPAHLDWKLTLAGDGPTLPACQIEAQRLGIAHRVKFPGLLKDPRSLYFDSDIAVHVSDRESLPNFLVEAQMSGLPIIAYDVNGVGETFQHQISGYLIPHNDSAAFLTALKKLARNPDLRLQMSLAARDYAERNFSIKSQTAAYFDLLHSSKESQ